MVTHLSLGGGRSKVLAVPYYAQPTNVQCQSTVLRMYAEYLEKSVVNKSTGGGTRDIADIWKDINKSAERPNKTAQNHHENMIWWLNKYFTPLKCSKKTTKDPVDALYYTVNSVDRGYPLMASVTHSRVKGHIVLVVGYQRYRPAMSSLNDDASFSLPEDAVSIVVHDPYGAFDPDLASKFWGDPNKKKGTVGRFTGSMSLMGGGEAGPGKNVVLPLLDVRRREKSASRFGNFELMSCF